LRGFVAALLVIAIAVSLCLPMSTGYGHQSQTPSSPAVARSPGTESLLFPTGVDTSSVVDEYWPIARALMLSGGSTDSVVADINADGRLDLVVAVSGTNQVSVFYRQPNNSFLSTPSANILLDSVPVGIAAIDAFSGGHFQIAVLEKRISDFEQEKLKIFNFTSETSPFYEFKNISVYQTAVDFVIGQFNLDIDFYPDIAFVCPSLDPRNSKGKIQILFGPNYGTWTQFSTGYGGCSIALGNFSGDGYQDLAVANFYDRNVNIFFQPFSDGNSPSANLTVTGNPVSLTAGDLNAGTLPDLAVATKNPSAVRFFFQSGGGGLPATEWGNRSLTADPSFIESGRINSDGLDDIIVLSANESCASGFLQQPISPTWASAPDFSFPTGSVPRSAMMADLDGDGSNDLGVASARTDWTGSSLAIYSYHDSRLSNSNATASTNKQYNSSMIAVGDIDGNDVDDLVSLHPSLGAMGYLLGNKVTGFTSSEDLHSLGFVPSELLVQDLNGDGRNEILISQSAGNGVYLYAWNVSHPGYFNSSQVTCQGNITDIALGDFNSDSLSDLAVATDNGTLEIFLNGGAAVPYSSLADESVHLSHVQNWTIAVGDFNDDGKDDIAYPYPTTKIGLLFQRASGPWIPSSPDVSLISSGPDFTALWSGDITGDGLVDIAAMNASDPALYMFNQTDFTRTYTDYGHVDFPEMPKYVSLIDATDDGVADALAIFASADLLFLYNHTGNSLSSEPAMVFVTGGLPNYATIGDGTQDHRADLLVNEIGSHTVSIWQQVNFPPVAHTDGTYYARQGDPLQFNGSVSAGVSEIPYVEYNWTFGDGSWTGFVRNPRPVHTYDQINDFDVTLVLRDPGGLYNMTTAVVHVIDSYPHADFTWSPLTPNEGDWVTLTDTTNSYDPILWRNWSIDGTPVSSGNELILSRQFQNGSHNVSLEATDSDGSVKTISHNVVIAPINPILSIDSAASALEGLGVLFSVDVDSWNGGPWDPIVKFEWDFSYLPGNFIAESDTETSNFTTHQFSAAGYSENYSVAVRATDDDGNQSIAWVVIEISDIGPTANFTLTPPSPEEGVPFAFDDTTSTWDGIVSGFWRLVYPDSHSSYYPLGDSQLDAVALPDGDYTMYLTVNETDGDTSDTSLAFHVREVGPSVLLETLPVAASYDEYSNITFRATVSSYDPIVGFQWDFDAPGGVFVPDRSTTANTTIWAYTQVGNYTAKVNVTDSDGSWTIVPMYVKIVHMSLYGSFNQDVKVVRDPVDTNTMTFDASVLAARFPDIVLTIWDFGDDTSLTVPGPPSAPVTHVYVPVADFTVRLTITDDDHQSFILDTTLQMKAPTIGIYGLFQDSVVKSSTLLQFIVGQGSTPIVSVNFSVNSGPNQTFSALYTVNTSGWADRDYNVSVRAADVAGNIAIFSIHIVVDNVKPDISMIEQRSSVYGGDKLAIRVDVTDANIAPTEIILYVKFQEDDSFTAYRMTADPSGVGYIQIVGVPARPGTIEYYVNVTDKAGNYQVTDLQSVAVKMHFIDVAWPFLLGLAILAALGTAGYFVREVKIAVDETFVIYNDGRLIAHSTRHLKPGMDDQVLSGMFVAIQDFVKDSFKDVTSFTLRKIEFGEKSVLIEKGDHLFLAVILHGKASKKVATKMQRIVDEIEEEFSHKLKGWDGDLDSLRGVGDIAKKLYSKAPLLPPFRRSNT